MSLFKNGCPYNHGVLCDDRNRCGKCGWNPDIRKKRVKRILYEHPEYGTTAVALCPFCGREPRITKLGSFVSIACGSRGCEMAGTGYCSSFTIARRRWNRRAFAAGEREKYGA